MKTAVIFDLDGTLLNTLADLREAANASLRLRGLPPRTTEEIRQFVGNGVRNLMQQCLPPEAADTEIDAALADFKQYYAEHLCVHTTPYAGIPELLKALGQRGVRMAVLSNKLDSASRQLMEHYFPQGTFAVVHGERDGIPRKPDPTSCRNIMRELKAAAEDVLYVGDSGVDMQTARNAGLYAVGVTWGFRSQDVLLENGADALIDRPEQLLNFI